jgi:integrase
VPLEQVREVYAAILADAGVKTESVRRQAVMDAAWFRLMLLGGLRVGEVRRLKLGDVLWEQRQVRIEQSKGLKDRLVPVTPDTLESLEKWLKMRGPKAGLPEHVFVYRHRPLTMTYCSQRLRTYCQRCRVSFTPHQLRHTAATLLLNAGAPVATVQQVLGHETIDTTLGYARLYDGTVAADYYRAMAQIEREMPLPGLGRPRPAPPPSVGELIALVDSLSAGTLSPRQSDTVAHLRGRLVALAEQGEAKAPPKGKGSKQ